MMNSNKFLSVIKENIVAKNTKRKNLITGRKDLMKNAKSL